MPSNNVVGADNQQGSPLPLFYGDDPSETTRRAPLINQEIIAYLQGALHDASLNKQKRFRFTQKNRNWLKLLSPLLRCLGYNSWIYREGKNRHIYTLEILANFLDFSFNPPRLLTNGEKEAYIRGFFDAEGGIPRNINHRFYIQFVQKNKLKLKRIQSILLAMDIASGRLHNPSRKVDPNYWRFFISSKSYKDFILKIGSWHPDKKPRLNERLKI